jgi:hypothetical protein
MRRLRSVLLIGNNLSNSMPHHDRLTALSTLTRNQHYAADDEQRGGGGLGDCLIGPCATSGSSCLTKICHPRIVLRLANNASVRIVRQSPPRRPEVIPPHGVIGGVHNAVVVVVASKYLAWRTAYEGPCVHIASKQSSIAIREQKAWEVGILPVVYAEGLIYCGHDKT